MIHLERASSSLGQKIKVAESTNWKNNCFIDRCNPSLILHLNYSDYCFNTGGFLDSFETKGQFPPHCVRLQTKQLSNKRYPICNILYLCFNLFFRENNDCLKTLWLL